jgi:pimeloyl-ACP methyl ester carboxylesterase
MVPAFVSHIEFRHEDKRGQGLSDRVSDAPSLELRMDDVRAIMDTIGSERATLFGHSERGSHELKGLPGRWDLFAASA